MSSPENTLSDIELNAYIDNELDSIRHAEIEEIINNNPELQSKVDEFRKINSGLGMLFQPHLESKVPKNITQTVKPVVRSNRLAQAASILLAVTIGLVSGWYGNSRFQQPVTSSPTAETLVKDAFAFHAIYTPEQKHPVEVKASQYTHLVNWLSKRLETQVRIPDLSRSGFELLGGRLLSSEERPAAQFMYENDNGQRVTILARNCGTDDVQTAFNYASKNNINGFYWTDENLSFVILSNIQKHKISEIAHTVYEEMNR